MTKKIKRWLKLVMGWSFVALGILGLVLPFLQGVLFLLVGISILSTEYTWARRLVGKFRERFPALSDRLDSAGAGARRWLRKVFPAKSDDARD